MNKAAPGRRMLFYFFRTLLKMAARDKSVNAPTGVKQKGTGITLPVPPFFSATTTYPEAG